MTAVASVQPPHLAGVVHAAPAVRARIRRGTAADAAALYTLIHDHLREGHLLPRTVDDIAAHVHRFIVATAGREIVGCAELAPLSAADAEIRSLVVAERARHTGLGGRLVNELVRRGASAGFSRLCAFTHSPVFFVQLAFSIVPHTCVPAKIATDCTSCPDFGRCGQRAVVRTLGHPRGAGAQGTAHV